VVFDLSDFSVIFLTTGVDWALVTRFGWFQRLIGNANVGFRACVGDGNGVSMRAFIWFVTAGFGGIWEGWGGGSWMIGEATED
jgi:hypothetical protein